MRTSYFSASLLFSSENDVCEFYFYIVFVHVLHMFVSYWFAVFLPNPRNELDGGHRVRFAYLRVSYFNIYSFSATHFSLCLTFVRKKFPSFYHSEPTVDCTVLLPFFD